MQSSARNFASSFLLLVAFVCVTQQSFSVEIETQRYQAKVSTWILARPNFNADFVRKLHIDETFDVSADSIGNSWLLVIEGGSALGYVYMDSVEKAGTRELTETEFVAGKYNISLGDAEQLIRGTRAFQDDSFKAAYELLEPLAGRGVSEAEMRIGLMYMNGYYVQRDPAKAFGWMERAASRGHAFGQYTLARFYIAGFGTPQDLQKASASLLAAHSQGYCRATLRLASFYMDQGYVAEGERYLGSASTCKDSGNTAERASAILENYNREKARQWAREQEAKNSGNEFLDAVNDWSFLMDK